MSENSFINFILGSVIRSIKIVAIVSLILSAVSLIAGIGLNWSIKEIFTITIVFLLSIFLLIVVQGLRKRKRWAWYLGIAIFTLGFIYSFFSHPQVRFLAGVITGLIWMGLLYCRKEYFKKRV